MSAPLTEQSENEIKAQLRANAEHVQFAYNDFVAELDRRAANRQARAASILSIVSVAIAVAALIVVAAKS